MKAWVSHSAGGPETLVLEERPMPAPASGELMVCVQAVGVNFPDGLLIRDLYQVKPPRPLVPGSEFCGVIEKVGDAVSDFQPGDVVMGRCGWGAMAEFIVIAQERCHKIPSNLPKVEAASFLFAYATAYHALHDAGRLQPGETLLILGAAGGVGSAAVEVGRALGARVIAAVSSKDKLDFARSRGASDGLVYDPSLQWGEDQKALAARFKEKMPGGSHLVVDPVGGPYSEPALRSLAPGGRHLVVGFTAGIPRVPLNLALLKRSHIIGVDWRMFVQEQATANERNVQSLLRLWQEGSIQPEVTETYPFSEAPSAIARLETRQTLGKIVVNLNYQ